MCMDNKANVGKDLMYSGTLGGNIGRGAANFTPTSQPEVQPEIRRATLVNLVSTPSNEVSNAVVDKLPVDNSTQSKELGVDQEKEVSVKNESPEDISKNKIKSKYDILKLREDAASEFDKKSEDLKNVKYTNPALEYSKWLYSKDKNEKYPALRAALLGTMIGPVTNLVTEPLGRLAKFGSENGLDLSKAHPSVVAQNIRRGAMDDFIIKYASPRMAAKQLNDYSSGVTMTPVQTISSYGY